MLLKGLEVRDGQIDIVWNVQTTYVQSYFSWWRRNLHKNTKRILNGKIEFRIKNEIGVRTNPKIAIKRK